MLSGAKRNRNILDFSGRLGFLASLGMTLGICEIFNAQALTGRGSHEIGRSDRRQDFKPCQNSNICNSLLHGRIEHGTITRTLGQGLKLLRTLLLMSELREVQL